MVVIRTIQFRYTINVLPFKSILQNFTFLSIKGNRKKFFFSGPATKASNPPPLKLSGHIFLELFFL